MRRTVLGRRGAPLWRPDLACGIERRLRRPLALSPAPDGTLRVPPVANPRRTSPPVRVRAPVPAPAQDRVQAAEAGGEAPDEGRAREGPAEPWVGTRRPQEARDPPARRGPVQPEPPRCPVPRRPRGETVRSEAMPSFPGVLVPAARRRSGAQGLSRGARIPPLDGEASILGTADSGRGPRARAVPPRSWACYGGAPRGSHGGLPRRPRQPTPGERKPCPAKAPTGPPPLPQGRRAASRAPPSQGAA